jgi:uncharacterized membrane protein
MPATFIIKKLVMKSTESDKESPVIPPSRSEKVLDLLADAGLLIGILVVAYFRPMLPDFVPSHFNLSGMPDGWSNSSTLLIFPVVSIICYLILVLFSRNPRALSFSWSVAETANRDQRKLARLCFHWLKMQVFWLFAYLEWKIIMISLGRAEGLGTAFIPSVLVIMLGTFYYFYIKAKYTLVNAGETGN